MSEQKALEQLKEMVGKKHDKSLFAKLLTSLSNDELFELEEYIINCKERCEQYILECRQRLRELNTTALQLKDEFHKSSQQAKQALEELKSFFTNVYKEPESAQQSCWSYEKQNGLEATAKVVRTQPKTFGTLKGITLFGFTFGPQTLEAQHQAVQSNYADMRKRLDEARENMHYIRMVFKGA